jgi:hypothetical protein
MPLPPAKTGIRTHLALPSGRALSVAFALLLLLAALDGVLPYAQMLLFRGAVPLRSGVVKAALLLVCLAAVAMREGRRAADASGDAVMLRRSITLVALLFALYLGVHAASLSRFPAGYTLLGFNSFYFHLLLAPLLLWSGLRIGEDSVVRAVALLLPGLLLLGAAQAVLGTPLLPVTSADGLFETNAWKFYGHVRAFSLFSSPAAFGGFLLFAALLMLAAAREAEGGRRALLIALAAAACGGLLLTRTRAVWLHAAVSVAAALLLPMLRKRRALLTVAPLLVGVLLLAGLALYQGAGAGHALSGESLLQRADTWWYAATRWLGADARTALFGSGYFQHGGINAAGDLKIDSTWLAAGLQTGVAGLFLLILLQCALWLLLVAKAAERGGIVATAAAVYWISWMALWTLGVATSPFALVFLLAVLAPAGKEAGRGVALDRPRLRGPALALTLGALGFAALLGAAALHSPSASDGAARWESRLRMKMLRHAQHVYRGKRGRWCDGVDSLLAFSRAAAVPFGNGNRYLPLYDAELPLDSLRATPRSGRPYIVLASPDGARYQIRDPDGFGYISSWTAEDEFDRASWE